MPGVAIATLGRLVFPPLIGSKRLPPALLLVETKKFD